MYPGKEYIGHAGGIYRLVQNMKQFEWFYERARKQPKLAVDTETSGVSWVIDHVAGMVIGWGPDNNYYLPIDHIDSDTGDRIPDQLSWLDIFQQMKILLENPDIVIYTHNWKFDNHMLMNLGIHVTCLFHDSLISSFLLDENVSHKLKDLSKLYVHEEADYYEDRIDKWRHEEAKRRRSALNAMISARAKTYKTDLNYMSSVTKEAVDIIGYYPDEHGVYPVDLKRKLTTTITRLLKTRAATEFEGHWYNKNQKDDISYDCIPLDEIAPYACADTHYTWIINELLIPIIVEDEALFSLYIEETTLCRNLCEIERVGCPIDKEYLESCGPELEAEAGRLEKRIYEQIGYEFNINSPDQLIKALLDAGCELTKITKGSKEKVEKTGNIDFAKLASDSEVLESLAAEHQFAKDIQDYRRAKKIKGTYVDGILGKLDKRNRVHSTIGQLKKTGRMGSSDPNLTNIDNKDTRIRRAFTAPPDTDDLLVFMDFSQIELRLTAHESQDPELLACYPMVGKGKDVHSLTCAEVIMGMDYDEFLANMKDDTGHDSNNIICECNQCVYDFKRKIAKRVNFGIIYGAGQYAIQRQVSTPQRYVSALECKHYITGYLEKYYGVKQWMDRTGRQLRRDGYVQDAFGRYRRLPDILVTTDTGYQHRMIRQGINFLIQGLAADIFKASINRIKKVIRNTDIKLINLVHDELQFIWPRKELHMIPEVKKCMETWDFSVPIVADVSYSETNWASKSKGDVMELAA
jgi:DNA polymerase I-like protein with 3'-5' exonuclease and polymerase domains